MENRKPAFTTDFTTGNLVKKLLLFSWPAVLSNLLQIVYNLVDMVIVGQVNGSESLTAVANGGDLTHLAVACCFGFSSAGQVMIAQCTGRGDRDGVRRNIGTMLSSLGIISLVFIAIYFLCIDELLSLMHIPTAALGQARSYTLICAAGMVFIYGYNSMSSVMRGLGDSVHPLLFISISTVLNIALDLLFVLGFRWDAAGAAAATVLSQALSFLSCVIFLYRHRDSFCFDFRASSFRIDGKTLFNQSKLAIPLALQFSAVTLSKLFVSSMVNSFGLVYAAINSVGTKLSKVAGIVCDALMTCATTVIGQCFGIGDKARIRRTVYAVLFIGLAYVGVLSVLQYCFPRQIFALFDSDPAVLDACMIYVPVSIVNFFAFPTRTCVMCLINGTGQAKLSLVQALFGCIICRIGLSYLLGGVLGYGIMGFWLGECIAGFIPFVVGGLYFWSGHWKRVVDGSVRAKSQSCR